MAIKTDTFTEASDTALESHTSDSGGGWSGADTTAFDVIAATDEVKRDFAGVAKAASGDEAPTSADYYVTVNGKTVDDGNFVVDGFGPAVRIADASNFYYVQVLRGTSTASEGRLRLYKNVATVHTQIGSDYNITSFAGSTYYDVKLQIEGTSLEVWLDGTSRIGPETDSALSAAGEVGFAIRNNDPLITSLDSDYLAAGVSIPVIMNHLRQQGIS